MGRGRRKIGKLGKGSSTTRLINREKKSNNREGEGVNEMQGEKEKLIC